MPESQPNNASDTRRLGLFSWRRTFLYGESLKVRSNEVDNVLVGWRRGLQYMVVAGSIAGLKTLYMSKICEITGKKTQSGGKYSNRVRATQFNPSGIYKRSPNLQKKRIYVAELDKTITVKVSTKGLRTIAKNGAYTTLKAANLI